MAQYDSSGAFKWVSPFYGAAYGGTTGSSSAFSLAIDNSGSILVGGMYSGRVDFNPGNGTSWLQNQGGFITKLTASGSLV